MMAFAMTRQVEDVAMNAGDSDGVACRAQLTMSLTTLGADGFMLACMILTVSLASLTMSGQPFEKAIFVKALTECMATEDDDGAIASPGGRDVEDLGIGSKTGKVPVSNHLYNNVIRIVTHGRIDGANVNQVVTNLRLGNLS